MELKPVGPLRLSPPELTSRVVAADGSLLAELHAEQDRELVPLRRVPKVLRDAVIATEDARFYDHGGVDARAIARAVAVNARTGRVRQGGSTITQQLAKNAVVGNDPTLERKLAEAATALRIERELSKDQILARYLNTVYFGNGAYGVATASRRYFGVDLEDVTLPQAALLAALLKAPGHYDPHAHPQRARQRRDLVLRLMARHKRITTAQQEQATQSELGVIAPTKRDWSAPWFVDHVLTLLQHDPAFTALGESPADRAGLLFRGGLRIETTLDVEDQEAAEGAVAATLSAPADPRAAVVSIDPATGGITAMVGGRAGQENGDDRFARFNLATDGRRQAGSAFKPLVLATALTQGLTLDDEFDGRARLVLEPRPGEPTRYPVRNYDNRDYGMISLRDATAHSVNVVYAALISQIGPEAVARTAARAGVTSKLPAVRSLALGAAEVSPLEMASVQATLAAGGIHRAPSAVTRITASDGRVLYERGKVGGKRAIDRAVAYLVTDALEGVVGYGTGQHADIRRPLAGKTGTTQKAADAWFVGYTPDMAAAVWVGFPEGAVPMEPPRTRITVEGGNWPAEIFARFGVQALADVPVRNFDKPAVDLVTVEVDHTRNCLPNPYTPEDLIAERDYVDGTQPTEVCREPTGPSSGGGEARDVPDTVGVPLAMAVRMLTEEGFEVDRKPESSSTLPPGYVVRQSPPGGQRQVAGRTVRIWVSTATRALAQVPEVVGLDVEDARARLEGGGFSVEVESACPLDGCGALPTAEVWRQTPQPGETVPAHSVVTLTATPDQ